MTSSSDRQRAHLDAESVTRARPSDRRSTSSKDVQGSAEDRRRRRAWLVETYRADVDADPSYVVPGRVGVPLGTGAPACRCYRCGRLLTVNQVSPDRIKPGCMGGTYKRENIRPSCDLCQMQTGGALGAARRKAKR
jgi:hypothetical protein